jgi:hypothetical protein
MPQNHSTASDSDRLRAVALVCTLKPSPTPSSSQLLAEQVLAELSDNGVDGEVVRVADHAVHPGITADEGDGDQWPRIREQVAAADVLVLATPIEYQDLEKVPDPVASTTATLARNAAHLARLLRANAYPPYS